MGYLMLLMELGLLSEDDEEMILDKIFYSGFQKIELVELKSIIASLILDIENKSEKLDRLFLQNNDTIH